MFQVRKAVINLILGTDFAKHFSILANFKDLMSAEESDMEKAENRNLILKVYYFYKYYYYYFFLLLLFFFLSFLTLLFPLFFFLRLL